MKKSDKAAIEYQATIVKALETLKAYYAGEKIRRIKGTLTDLEGELLDSEYSKVEEVLKGEKLKLRELNSPGKEA